MGIAGAALYSLILIARLKLAQLASHAKHELRWLWSIAHCGPGLHAAPRARVQRPISKR